MSALTHIRAALGDPWGLTARQAEVLAAVLRHGSMKAAARELGLANKTITSTLAQTRQKMRQRTTLHALVAWDRYARKD